MKVVEIRDTFRKLEHLKVCERGAPQPGSGQVVINVKAASLQLP